MPLDHPPGTVAWAPRQSPVTADARFREVFGELYRKFVALEKRVAELEQAATAKV
jgi:hypothetical protein